mmetsp:Transcript_27830/g.61614  ORF Transcript_27830/g.61614 Transcript_27830/m.61614 type:complete len:463 (-) Transcript_27830:320-1708(-)
MDTRLLLLTKECWHQVAGYLNVADALDLAGTCRFLQVYLAGNMVWEEFAGNLFAPYAVGVAASSERDTVPVRLLGVPEGRLFLCRTMALLQQHALVNLATKVVAASSVDRGEEAPHLALLPSRCQVSLASSLEEAEAVPRFLQYAAWMQGHCGCGGLGGPCYWSSAPSRLDSTVEYLTVSLQGPALVAGFSVTPYQAFFHPDAPIYAPVEVAIQFLRSTPNTTPGAVRFAAGCPLIPLTPEQLEIKGAMAKGEEGQEGCAGGGSVYYQSPFFQVQKVFKSQTFMLPSPVLCFPYDEGPPLVRLLFRGKQQRQTLGPDDFYMCICNVQVLALPQAFDLVPGRARLPHLALSYHTGTSSESVSASPPPPATCSVLPPTLAEHTSSVGGGGRVGGRWDGFHLLRRAHTQRDISALIQGPAICPDFVTRHLTGDKKGAEGGGNESWDASARRKAAGWWGLLGSTGR